jgi:hypothetical protein
MRQTEESSGVWSELITAVGVAFFMLLMTLLLGVAVLFVTGVVAA